MVFLRRKKVHKSSSYINNFVNSMVKRGKKAKAYKFYHNTLATLKFQTKESPITILENSFIKLKPIIRVVPFKRGARSRHLPLETTPRKQRCAVVKWIIRSSNEGSSRNLFSKLANTVWKASQDKGSAIEKKKNYYKLGVQNKRTLKALKVWRWFRKRRKKRRLWRRFRNFFSRR